MRIYITPKGESRKQFPMNPEYIQIGADTKFMTYNFISIGEVKIPRGRNSIEVSWTGTIPGNVRQNEPYVSCKVDAASFVALLNRIRDNQIKCRLLITETAINMDVYIASFKGKYTGGHGDFDYDIKFSEKREVEIVGIVKSSKKPTTATTTTKRTPSKTSTASTKSKTRKYTVKKGDSLYRIAKKLLGNGNRWNEIYNLNKKKIKNKNLIYPGQVFTIPAK